VKGSIVTDINVIDFVKGSIVTDINVLYFVSSTHRPRSTPQKHYFSVSLTHFS
jgi:hypothetical protein